MYGTRRGFGCNKKKSGPEIPGRFRPANALFVFRRGLRRLIVWRIGGWVLSRGGCSVRAASRDGRAVHDLTVAGERLRDALRRLLLFAGRHRAGKLDGV